MAKNLKGWLGESKENQRLFAQEALILEVTEAIWAALEKRHKSKADLARALETSKAYVTQLLDGGRNMTLRTLADIAYNLNFEPHFQLCERNMSGDWMPIEFARIMERTSLSSVEPVEAANQGKWSNPQELSAAA